MKKYLLLSLCFASLYCTAESVAVLRYVQVQTPEAVYPNSLFWIDPSEKDKMPYTLQSAQQKIRLVPQKAIYPIHALPFKPEIPLSSQHSYRLNTAEEGERFAEELTYHFKVKNNHQATVPQWTKSPKLEQVDFYPHENALRLRFSTPLNLNPHDYLIQIRIAPLHIFATESAYLVQPTLNDRHELSFDVHLDTKSMTLLNADLRGDLLKMKFDLIRYDGKVIPWQGKAVKYLMKNKTTTD